MTEQINEIAYIHMAMESEQAYNKRANEFFINLISKMLQTDLFAITLQ